MKKFLVIIFLSLIVPQQISAYSININDNLIITENLLNPKPIDYINEELLSTNSELFDFYIFDTNDKITEMNFTNTKTSNNYWFDLENTFNILLNQPISYMVSGLDTNDEYSFDINEEIITNFDKSNLKRKQPAIQKSSIILLIIIGLLIFVAHTKKKENLAI